MVAGALLAASLQQAGLPAAREIDPATLLRLDAALCTQPPGAASNRKVFLQLAQATKNELRPLGQLPETQARGGKRDVKDPPLYTDLGKLQFPITTSVPLAQQYFNQGMRLTYAFNHAEAIRAYRAAQRLDPQCAMCFWGEALALGPNINMPMDPQANPKALAALQRAQALQNRASAREQGLIEALAKRYSDAPDAERAALDVAYADAMGLLAKRYPKDQDLAVLYAESLMDIAPWDYWEAGGTKPKGRTAELVATLESVLKANPNHPGAIHYYIHTVEASSDPKRAEPYAEKLGKLAPGAGHLVHMPAHIYYRVGRYQDSLAANRQAVAVDEAYIASQKPEGIYPQGYYPHNVHFLMVSAQMAGDGDTAIKAADKLNAIVSDDAAREFALAQPVKAAPYFAHTQFSRPEAILKLPPPGTGLPYVEGIWHYARGVAYAMQGNTEKAAQESAAIGRLRTQADFAKLHEAQVPAEDVLQIAQLVVDARIDQAKGNLPAAIGRFEQAVTLEDKLAYMEPPYWYYPLRQSLGALRLINGDTDGAEQAFRASLAKAPNNGWALYGLAEVFRKRGDEKELAAAKALQAKSWAGKPGQLSLARL
ncbi:tetratricopeptide repeat protein [Paucimonas lemoignei]|uniref:Tetratricopeptide repeat protein n=2 Tax=Paucimonas lemoignei TaxID=29443 RepID=A0A4R3HXR2_PAULE|nr:tetratricopeptide repeat protein [Paucimonas lemoignei]